MAVTDLAFGWQSTLRVGAEGMGAVVSLLALPWSWLPPQWGLVPDLAQIEGSRIVLKDGIAALASADLAAWWPFLAMCLLLYAVLPRLVLLSLTHSCLRRLEREGVHPDLARIADRMRSPLVGGSEAGESVHAPLPVATTQGGVQGRPVEAWQPPIRESLRALKLLGEEGGEPRSLALILAGRPAAGNWLTIPAQADLEAWTEALERLRPLRIDIFGAAR